jgi:PAS domain S-box-containing protein
MWSEHDTIREIEKGLFQLMETRESAKWTDFITGMEGKAVKLAEMLENHFYKENNILFPTALKLFSKNEWKEIRMQFDDLGYCCFTPPPPTYGPPEKPSSPEGRGTIGFETGTFSRDQLESVLNTLPVDITFVDTTDSVKYFNKSEERIFPRTKAVIGRQVQQCHPQKSVHKVNQILDEFRSGESDSAEFWINLQDRLIYIRYFAVRNSTGTYLGCLEVTQDITDLKAITGEKRLLD